jgi:hypothetical protein
MFEIIYLDSQPYSYPHTQVFYIHPIYRKDILSYGYNCPKLRRNKNARTKESLDQPVPQTREHQ